MLKAGLNSTEVLNGLCGKCETWEQWTKAWAEGGAVGDGVDQGVKRGELRPGGVTEAEFRVL